MQTLQIAMFLTWHYCILCFVFASANWNILMFKQFHSFNFFSIPISSAHFDFLLYFERIEMNDRFFLYSAFFKNYDFGISVCCRR